MVVDDEPGIRQLCCDVLRRSGYTAESASDASAALRRVEAGLAGSAQVIDLVLTDIKMKPLDGLAFLEALRGLNPALRVIIMTGYPTLETAVEGMRLGAKNYVTKPFTPIELRKVVAEALEGWIPSGPSQEEGDGEVERLDRLVGRSAQMRSLFQTLRRAARTEAMGCITGDPAAGKEEVAGSTHRYKQPQ